MKFGELKHNPHYWAFSTSLTSALAGYEMARLTSVDAAAVFEGLAWVGMLSWNISRFKKTMKSQPLASQDAGSARMHDGSVLDRM